MKIHRLPLLIVLLLAVSLLLTACGGTAVQNWPGVSAGEGTVYVSYQGAVYAVNASNGAMLWRYPEKPDATKPFYAAPALGQDGLVIVGNYGHALHAIDSSGKEAWVFTIENGNFVATPLVTENLILAPASDDRLYALTMDGQEAWTFKASHMLWAQPVTDGTLAFVPGMDHNLYALDLQTGEVAWQKDLGSALLSSPVMGEENVLYIATLEGDVIAIQPGDGTLIWRTPTSGRIWASPALHEGVLYTGNTTGKVFAISAEDGAVAWEQDAKSPIYGGPAVLADAVAYPTEGGELVAFALDGSKELWRQPVNGKLYTTPVVSGENVVVAVLESDKLLQAFTLTGQVAWPFSPPK